MQLIKLNLLNLVSSGQVGNLAEKYNEAGGRLNGWKRTVLIQEKE